MAFALGGGVVVDHGIDVAAVDKKAQPGPAKFGEIPVGLPIGLGEHRHFISEGFQLPGDDGHPEAGVVHIGVPGDADNVHLLPAQGAGLLRGDG